MRNCWNFLNPGFYEGINSSMSNAPWKSKRDELQEHSVLLLNNELLSKPSWDENTIRCRSQRMIPS